MTTRSYTLGRIMTGATTPDHFTVDDVNYSFNITASSTYPPQSDAYYPWYAMDSLGSTGRRYGWSAYIPNVNIVHWWQIMFEDEQILQTIELEYVSRGRPYVRLLGYDGDNWTVITTFPGTAGSLGHQKVELPPTTIFYGFRIDAPAGTDSLSIYDIYFTFLFNQDPVNHTGILVDEINDSIVSSNTEGLEIDDVYTVDKTPRPISSYYTDEIDAGTRLIRKDPGVLIDDILISTNNGKNNQGTYIDDILLGERNIKNIVGIYTDDILTSNTNNNFNLLVTPTHQYKTMPVHVKLTNRIPRVINGKYAFFINDLKYIDYTNDEEDISNIDFNIQPSQLNLGLNICRFDLLINDVLESIDFEIFKEEANRTSVERLFRYYDGGFDGEFYAPPKILIPDIYPAWTGSFGSPTTRLIKTTDYTRVPLTRDMDLQGVNIVGNNLKILVSLDKGITWKSFISNKWETIDIDNISTSGMDVTTINGITIAQWEDLRVRREIDFAIYFSDPVQSVLFNLSSNPTINTFEYVINGSKVSAVEAYGGYYTALNATVYSNITPDGRFVGNPEISGSYIYYAQADEVITKVTGFVDKGRPGNRITIYGKNSFDTYLKSINVGMTPSQFRGYAFIL